MVTIEINGQQVEAEQGQMLIEAADKAGIAIPRFCYHKNLSISASCRMCLVEVEKAPKPMPACATPVADGMVVNTQSTYALAAQKSVMEFLLINHPLDCPVCDQGGECDLQEFSIGYGDDKSRYAEIKRVVKDKNIGPLVATELTRCIHCTRCVRFGQEIAGMRELGATGRGDWMEIGTYISKSVDSELSGNIIDLCPVGALTSKVSRFTYRVWELASNDSISAHDCVGSNCNVQTKNGEIKRVIARENDAINDAWISDRDRYSFEGLQSDERLTTPMIKKEGKWAEASWDDALQFAVNGLKDIDDKTQIGAICSPSASTEEMYLLQKMMRGIGSNNIDHRLRQSDFSAQDQDPVFPGLGMSVADISAQQAVLVIGSNVRKEQPIMGHQLRQASLNGANISFVNPVDFDFNFNVAHAFTIAPSHIFKELKVLAKATLENSLSAAPGGLAALVSSVKVTDEHKQCITELSEADNSVVMLGTLIQAMPNYASIRMLASYIADATNSTLSYLSPGANTAGAYLSGLLPNRTHVSQATSTNTDGLNTQAMLNANLKAYLLYGIEAERDLDKPVQAVNALNNAQFVVSLSAFVTDAIKAHSDVILPVAAMTESSGTLINAAGSWQSFTAVSKAKGLSKPGWKVLRVMGNLFNIGGFDYQSSEDVINELKSEGQSETSKSSNQISWMCPENISAQTSDVQRIAELPIYNVDAVTRRATALQQTQDAQVDCARINSALAKKLKLEESQPVTAKQGDNTADVTISIDDRITDNCVYLPAGNVAASSLGGGFDAIELLSKS
ncbi:MAG: NADH-quinone oxidoreductase subunit NuoG [gamma proteobacterium symbiont of Bathyaustriella thionipta]|nr:NADH-quinone oxidoreductase subunit NuoG [gamma proteobacterium symbiont of Bathyaustriella thionipta]MCU7948860.1 NADH-quinone oxidoreductase subunit NuoG [gamma proteobacterium symbiont of Bathyaustriella thionipta]MCU7951931.1 NADH-quinone oxidoreductase subunit NuoG [gamma proteobacterium symbiont of Bathyaustriella thionipta]MCU7955434.1 NADH-quinone oxidoreductase subunit NuoG [gamma proteobacterium symbiont of Bathyaustriella thionipta]MCU7965749.1 NADH-quinone oxidoreductase subunit 